MTQLLLGCGRDRTKKLHVVGREAWDGLVTVDMNPDVAPDLVWDLCDLPLPFADNQVEEIHLYDVLEHTCAQGDWLGLFAEFSEFWRLLKPGGHLFGIVPRWDGAWAWGDPGHRRVIQAETLSFLSQATYAAQLDGAERTNRTDYRRWWRGDFEMVAQVDLSGPCFGFVLEAIKPARIAP
jgi:SAM-dependent methyltransferase